MSTEPIQRTVRLTLPRGVAIERIVLVQDPDSNQGADGDYQRLDIAVEDAGVGTFLILKTERWAIDSAHDLALILAELVKEKLP